MKHVILKIQSHTGEQFLPNFQAIIFNQCLKTIRETMEEADMLGQGQNWTKFCIKSDFRNMQLFKNNRMLKYSLIYDIHE